MKGRGAKTACFIQSVCTEVQYEINENYFELWIMQSYSGRDAVDLGRMDIY